MLLAVFVVVQLFVSSSWEVVVVAPAGWVVRERGCYPPKVDVDIVLEVHLEIQQTSDYPSFILCC